MDNVMIGGKPIGPDYPCYVIAEIGINHNGDLKIAKQLIDVAKESGCDAVKFQKRDIDSCYSQEALATLRESPWGTTNRQQKEGLEFGQSEYEQIDEYCRKQGIVWFASCWDELSVDFINKFNPPAFKISSARIQNEDKFLRYHRQTGKTIIASTGACEEVDIRHAVEILGETDLALMHCVLQYPCDPKLLNLRMVSTLQAWFPDIPVGYSGHEVGVAPSLMAVVLGACLIERHITIDRAMYGSDQAASLEPGGIGRLVRDIREWEEARGDGKKRILPDEAKNLSKLKRP